MQSSNVKRFVCNEPSEYKVVGVLIEKTPQFTLDGRQVLKMEFRIGDRTNPIDFLDFIPNHSAAVVH